MTWQVLLYLFCSLFSMSFFHVNFAKMFFDLRALNQERERYNFRLYQLEVFFLQILLHTFRQKKLRYGQYVLNDFRNFFWKFYCFKFACFFISSGLCFFLDFNTPCRVWEKRQRKGWKCNWIDEWVCCDEETGKPELFKVTCWKIIFYRFAFTYSYIWPDTFLM